MILFDASSISAESATGGTMSWSHTCGTGPDTMLIVNTCVLGGGMTSITYNSVAMTLARSDVKGVTELNTYYLFSPSTGTNTITINYTAIAYGSGGALSVFGAKQSSQPNASAVSSTNGNINQTSISTTVSPTVKGCWVVSNSVEALSRLSCGWSPSAGQVQFACHGAGNSSSYYPNFPATNVSKTMTDATGSSNTKWQNAVAFAPDHFGYPVSIFNKQMI